MDKVSPTTLWSVISIVAAAIGGLFFVYMGHANEPTGHSGVATEDKVSSLEIKVERVAVKVDHNKDILEELKDDVKGMRVEQNAYTASVLEAIERSR